ncbi:Glycosyltransferase Family 10 protein [Gigaspora rosea]|uniref:Fucosyltransferase n=1 Tax=Gigaspora rosea TaxID=44941 RepID=A0A397UTR9_9GLOM|nr:Glycosyltransferase Family 10 protein [Gigaspora rosea]
MSRLINPSKYIFLTIGALIIFIFISLGKVETPVYEPIEVDYMTKLIEKPTNFTEWKQRHHITGYINKNRKVRIYITEGGWYASQDFLKLKFKHDETLANCDIPCIWKIKTLKNLTYEELREADALLCVNQPNLPKNKTWNGQKFIQYTLEPMTHCPQCHDKNKLFDIRATHNESSDIPTSYIRMDTEKWRIRTPFNITKLSQNSTFISFIASHWTEFRGTFIKNLQTHIPVASFGKVYQNTNWEIYPECKNLGFFELKNCVISKYPFYLSIENSQEEDYTTEKLWDVFNLGVVPVIWGAPNTRSYLPHPNSAIFIEDFPDTEALANYLKYLVKNETAYLEYHKWRNMEFSDEFKKKSYMSMYNLECNVCREVARLRIIDEEQRNIISDLETNK